VRSQPPPGAVRWLTGFIDLQSEGFDAACSFWQELTRSTLSPPRGPAGEFATLVPENGDAFVRVQRLGSGSAGCHLDIHFDDVGTGRALATSLGATPLRPPAFVSPGGLAFCVVPHRGEAHRPTPLVWPDGHRSLVDQMCLDIPPRQFDDEASFWAALTGWERRSGSRPEFEYLLRPPGIPLRLLLQHLDEDQPGPCRAHLDLACDDVISEQKRHELLGATVVRAMPNWTTMRGPAGTEYCITRRDPFSGVIP
jgi:hypothetical protein